MQYTSQQYCGIDKPHCLRLRHHAKTVNTLIIYMAKCVAIWTIVSGRVYFTAPIHHVTYSAEFFWESCNNYKIKLFVWCWHFPTSALLKSKPKQFDSSFFEPSRRNAF